MIRWSRVVVEEKLISERMFKAVMQSRYANQSRLAKKENVWNVVFNHFPWIYVTACLACLPQLTDLLRTFHKLALIYDLSGRAAPSLPSPAPRQPQKGVDWWVHWAIVCNFCDVQNAEQDWIYEASG